MTEAISLLVMAAGMGSRYGGLKQLDPVGPSGEVLLDYAVYDAKQAGISRVVFLIRKDLEADFRKVIGKRYEGKVDVAYAFQELLDLPKGFSVPEGRKKPWGTGQAILAAGQVIRGPFVAINADDFYARIYAYENDVPYSFYIPAFSNKGTRTYITLNYSFTRHFEMWFRVEQTWYSNVQVISEGSLTQIDSNHKTDFKIQARYKF
jgi:hypothetical protein